MSIGKLPLITIAATTALVPVSVNGDDCSISLANLPISTSTQRALDALEALIGDGGGGGPSFNPEIITGLVGDAFTPNDATYQNAIDDQVDAGGILVRINTAGTYRIANGVDNHPSISMPMDARGAVILEAGDNMPATRPDGAENSIIRILARTHSGDDDDGVLSYVPVFSGFNIQGRKTNQVNPVHGVRLPNPNPDDNSIDPDPNFTTNKNYAAARFMGMEISGCSGDGIKNEAGRGRILLWDTRCLNNGGNGAHLMGNDMVVGDRCGFGGNKGIGLLLGSGTTGLVHDTNMWGATSDRSKNALPFKALNTGSGSMRGCMINDTALWDGRDERRSWVAVANLFNPDSNVFDADGHGYDDIDAEDDPLIQCHVAVRGYKPVTLMGNYYFRSKGSVPFATPSNVGGATDGSKGTAFPYCIYASDNAQLAIIENFTSQPDFRPWSNPDPVPILCDSGATATYLFADTFTGAWRMGARGAGQDAHFAVGIDEADPIDLDFCLQVGSQDTRHKILGPCEFGSAPLLRSSAIDNRDADAGSGVTTLSNKIGFQRIRIPASGVANLEIRLAYIPNGSRPVLIEFDGALTDAIGTITWKSTRADNTLDTITAAGTVNFNANTAYKLPKTIKAGGFVFLFWNGVAHEYYCLFTDAPADPWVAVTPVVGVISIDASLGSSFDVAALTSASNTLNFPTNLVDSQVITIRFKQDGTGGRTITPNAKYKFPTNYAALPIGSGAGKTSRITGRYHKADDVLECTVAPGFG